MKYIEKIDTIISTILDNSLTWWENLSYFPKLGLLTSSIILGVGLFFWLVFIGIIFLLMGVLFLGLGIYCIFQGYGEDDLFKGLGGCTMCLMSILVLLIWYAH